MSFVNTAKNSKIPLLTILIVVLTVGTVLAIAAFTQTSPSTTIPAPPPPTMTPSCSALANFTTPTPITGSVAYSCTGQPQAFVVSNGPVTVTSIVHNLPSTLTLAFYPGAQNLKPCPGTGPSAQILNNTTVNIAAGSYNYCVYYTGLSTGLVFTFSVDWK